jgi:hypothetical protein
MAMKRTWMPALALVTVMGAATAAQAGTPTVDDVSKAVAQASWDQCITLVDGMLQAGTPSMTLVTIRSGKSSSLDPGIYALTAMREACAEKYLPRGLKDLALTGRMMLERGALLEAAYDAHIQAASDMTARCHAGAQRLLALGAAPVTPVVVGTTAYRLDQVGSRLCSQGDALIAAANQQFMGKYIGVLEGDKLALIEKSPVDGYLAGPSEERTSDPEVLASAKVWFETSSREPGLGDRCPTTIHVYRRFQFDARHRLVKESKKEYCGAPGARAMR